MITNLSLISYSSTGGVVKAVWYGTLNSHFEKIYPSGHHAKVLKSEVFYANNVTIADKHAQKFIC